eukprot:2552972-Rhodomonas_salina.2
MLVPGRRRRPEETPSRPHPKPGTLSSYALPTRCPVLPYSYDARTVRYCHTTTGTVVVYLAMRYVRGAVRVECAGTAVQYCHVRMLVPLSGTADAPANMLAVVAFHSIILMEDEEELHPLGYRPLSSY